MYTFLSKHIDQERALTQTGALVYIRLIYIHQRVLMRIALSPRTYISYNISFAAGIYVHIYIYKTCRSSSFEEEVCRLSAHVLHTPPLYPLDNDKDNDILRRAASNAIPGNCNCVDASCIRTRDLYSSLIE